MSEQEVSSTVTKNIAISLVLLSLQIFYTMIIVVDWFQDLRGTHSAYKVFDKVDYTANLLKQDSKLDLA